MVNFLKQDWGWKSSGIALTFIMIITISSIKPVGVSTQFVIFNGIIYNFFNKDLIKQTSEHKYESKNDYLNKNSGKYAKNILNPLNYSFIFVFAMIIGGFIASKIHSNNEAMKEDTPPTIFNINSKSKKSKYLLAFIGGVLVLFGARLAGGCTSGHMMSGMMQTSISGYLFAIGAFTSAVIVSLLIYKERKV